MALLCPSCDIPVENEEMYETIFRCPKCGAVGNINDFIEGEPDEENLLENIISL